MPHRTLTLLASAVFAASLTSQEDPPTGVPDVRAATVVVRTTYSVPGPGTVPDIAPSVVNTTADKVFHGTTAGAAIPDNPSHHDFVCSGATTGPTPTDSQVIQAAIDYVNKATGNRGGRVVLMEGTYNISTPITLTNTGGGPGVVNADYNGIIIEGQSTGGISFDHGTPVKRTGTILRAANDISALLACTRVSHFELRSLTFQMGESPTSRYAGTAAWFSDCTDVKMSRCTFDWCERAIYNNGGWDFITNECAFRSCGTATTPQVVADGLGTRLEGMPMIAAWKLFQCSWLPKRGVCFHSATCPAVSVHFLQCKFEGWPTCATVAITGMYHNLCINNCEFFKMDDDVLTVPKFDGTQVTISPHIYAVSEQSSIANNHFWDYDGTAIWLRGRQNKIQGNQFRFGKFLADISWPAAHIYFDTIFGTAPWADDNLVIGNTSWSEKRWDPITGAPLFTLPIANSASGGFTAVHNLGH